MATRRKRGRRIRSEANPPPSMISKIGDDLLLEILIRLPNPRSVCRCETVCKDWKSLISDHRFNRRFVSHHQTLHKQQTLPLHADDATDPRSVIMSFLPPMPDRVRECFKVLDCFKDLLLCGFADAMGKNSEIGRSYVVCNPFTKQWIALPLAPKKRKGYAMPVTRLVCEPRSKNGNFKLDLGDGQVFVYSEYRFRVVCIYQHKKSIKLDVFCPESGKWTKEAVVYDGFHRLRHKNVCSCNGKLFWLCVEAGQGYNDAEFVSDLRQLTPRWTVFQPRISCWPTPIPRYEELRGMYDGSCSWFRSAANASISLNSGSVKNKFYSID